MVNICQFNIFMYYFSHLAKGIQFSEYFQLLYGVLGGFGLGLIYLPAVVAVGYYFDSKRALATGFQKLRHGADFNCLQVYLCVALVLALSSLLPWQPGCLNSGFSNECC